MLNLNFILILSIGIISALSGVTKSEECITSHHSLKYYEELNCIPSKDETKNNCITGFNCSSIFSQKDDKCYYRGKAYSVGEELTHDDILGNCIPSCRCTNPFGRATFSCPHVDCPEIFQPPLKQNCIRTYSHESCCAVGTYCDEGNDRSKAAKCEYGGKTYLEGSSFYPEETPCKKCICKPGFNGSLESPWCEDIYCDIEIHYSENIQEACAPVYYGNDSCCPIYYHCQTDISSSTEMEETYSQVSHKINENIPGCKFGNMTVELGRKIQSPEECIECSCSVPPFVSCIVDGSCQEKNRKSFTKTT